MFVKNVHQLGCSALEQKLYSKHLKDESVRLRTIAHLLNIVSISNQY